MGTMITLGVGKLEISWGKNNIFDNFCDLFQPEDWKDIKYYYADNIVETKKGYSRKPKMSTHVFSKNHYLKRIITRINCSSL